MFLRICLRNVFFIKKQHRIWHFTYSFLLNKTSWACLLGSVLKLIFQWNARLLILLKCSLSSFAEVLISWTTEKKGVSSTNSLTKEVKPSGKSFILVKNNRELTANLEELLQQWLPQKELDPWVKPFVFYYLKVRQYV